jgi:hypothetical protein
MANTGDNTALTADTVTVKEPRNRPDVPQRIPGGLGSQIFMTFCTWRWWGQPHAPAAFTPRKYSQYSFLLEAESILGLQRGRKDYVNEKSQWPQSRIEPPTFGQCVNHLHHRVLLFNPSNAELNPIHYLLALLAAHHILHVSRIRVKFS